MTRSRQIQPRPVEEVARHQADRRNRLRDQGVGLCSACRGTSYADKEQTIDCENCGGTGCVHNEVPS
jgi:hypothetical protein